MEREVKEEGSKLLSAFCLGGATHPLGQGAPAGGLRVVGGGFMYWSSLWPIWMKFQYQILDT